MKNAMFGIMAGLCLSADVQNDTAAGGVIDETAADLAFGEDMEGAWPSHKRGGGGGRPSPFLDAVRLLLPGAVHREPITMTDEDGGDLEKAARRITAKIYRKVPGKTPDGKATKVYALGWKPQSAIVKAGEKVGNYTAAGNEVWIRRKTGATPAPVAAAVPAAPVTE